ncbi:MULTISPECIES: ribonuclease Z [Methanobacterium]|jgi:ribonuclease Z|uniref:Ribonuclease Z n=1 Tax=Methanobacterium veterum TaxID=408577 RepID=A0A9E5A2Z7_9EURY|nr:MULTISPECIES: ribonuclease Z [Methanobacterium]MCZ3364776.1 ribonuclease Z [Methanobacterium veterum]MCZ3372530.1 ribonuclease Z [Methanobacterium veterum]
MELVFLGTSSAIPTRHRNHSSIALKAFGEIFLFDCGEGTQLQMSKAKISPMKINNIFITHFHGDHILGLPGIIQSMAFRGRKNPLHIFGPKGLVEMVNIIRNFGYFSLTFEIYMHEIDDGIILEEENYRVSCSKMNHTVLNFAYGIYEKRRPKFIREKAIALGINPGPDFGKLQQGIPVKVGDKVIQPEQVLGGERKGRKIVYSGDTTPSEGMVEFAKDADLLIHESTFEGIYGDKAYEMGHSTSVQAAEIAKKANVKRLILTHVSTRYKKSDILESEAKEIFENSTVAEDFMEIEVER